MKHHFTLSEDLILTPVGDFNYFTQNSVGTKYLTVKLDGWSLGEGETLSVAFENKSKTMKIDPILMGKERDQNVYYTVMPTEVMKIGGAWDMCIYKKLNYNEESCMADAQDVGQMIRFEVLRTIRDDNGFAITPYDLANLSQFQRDLESGVYAARGLYAWNQKFEYNSGEIVFYPCIPNHELGSLVRSRIDKNSIAPYDADGVLDTEHWEEIVDLGNITDVFFEEVKDQVGRAQKARDEAVYSAHRAEDAAGSLADYVSRTVRFVQELPPLEEAEEQVIYAVVANVDANLFDLHALKNGEYVYLGAVNIVAGGVKRYKRLLLGGRGWVNNRQAVDIPNLEAGQNITAYAAEGSESAYMAAWLTCENEDGVAVFTCKSPPQDNISVVVEVQVEYELPSVSEYWTGKQTEEKISEAINAVTDGAPEAYDTLKEIADWIKKDETGTAALIGRVSKNEDDIKELQEAGVAIPIATVTVAPSSWGNKSIELTASDSASLANVTMSSELLVLADADSAGTVMSCNVRAMSQGTGTVTLSCDTVPTKNVTLKIIIFN